MISKVLAVVSLVMLPLSVSLWHKSHYNPEHYRYDVTLFKSLRVYLRDGVCGLRLLSMPKQTALRGEFRSTLAYNPLPKKRVLMLASSRTGPYRVTWLVFPFWLSTTALTLMGATPIVRGPLRRRWRRWRGACAECGYNLWGNRSGRCPECGTRVHVVVRARRRHQAEHAQR